MTQCTIQWQPKATNHSVRFGAGAEWGARGLAEQVNIGLRNADSGLGLTAGLSMAFLAMMADRILRGFVRVFT